MRIGDIILFTMGNERSWGLGILVDKHSLNHDQIYKIYFPNKNIQLLYTEVEIINNAKTINKKELKQ